MDGKRASSKWKTSGVTPSISENKILSKSEKKTIKLKQTTNKNIPNCRQ